MLRRASAVRRGGPLAYGCSLLAMAISLAVNAEDPSRAYRIGTQPLSQALIEFSKQSDIAITVDGELVKGLQAPAVNGQMSSEEALELLLKGTGLTYRRGEKGNYMITPVMSKNQGADADRVELDEIVVTATRRNASMQDIPMSINAFRGDQLEERGVEDLRDMQFLAAGMQVHKQGNITQITMRGIGNNLLSLSADSGVSAYKDGVYLAERRDLGASFFDVERIEVLRGPQGTLYGRNATGGAINIITKTPTSEFEAGGNITFGNYDLLETEGYVSGSLAGEELLARLAFKTRDHDGYTPNVFDDRDQDNEDFVGVRTRLRYEPVNNFSFDFIADYSRDDGLAARVFSRGREGKPLVVETLGSILPSGRAVNLNDPTFAEQESWGLTTKAKWNLRGMTMTSLTAYREYSELSFADFDGGDVSRFFFEDSIINESQFSQDIIIASADSDRFQWVAGATYFFRDLSSFANLVIGVPSTGVTTPIPLEVPELKDEAYAVFGELNYIFDRITITFGTRYSDENKTIEQFVGSDFEKLDDGWDNFSPRLAIGCAFSDEIIAFASISQGFKAGGFNTGTLQSRGYEPEDVTSYEVGVKSSLYNNRLHANLSLFYMDYAELQVLVRRENPLTTAPQVLVDNAASANILGFEFEFQVRPTDQFVVNGSLSWLDATFEKWPDAIDETLGGAAVDVSGNRLLNAPEWALNLGANYTVSAGNWGSVTLYGEYSYKSRTFFTPFEDKFGSQEGFNLFNTRLMFEDTDGNKNIAVWVKNISDEEVATYREEIVSSLTGNRLAASFLPPRTYGITIGYRF